jgi:hypothetical protein
VQAGVDAYLTGEISEPTVHIARESGVHFISAGHHATERYGVQALAQVLADKFDLAHQCIDLDNPVERDKAPRSLSSFITLSTQSCGVSAEVSNSRATLDGVSYSNETPGMSAVDAE